MNQKTYDALKWVAQVLLPGVATLYFALASIWGLPAAEQVVGTITAVDAFLGVLLHIDTKSYEKKMDGTLSLDTTNPERDIMRLELNDDLDGLAGRDRITFRVNSDTKEVLS